MRSIDLGTGNATAFAHFAVFGSNESIKLA
jgi:hypothetical protein